MTRNNVKITHDRFNENIYNNSLPALVMTAADSAERMLRILIEHPCSSQGMSMRSFRILFTPVYLLFSFGKLKVSHLLKYNLNTHTHARMHAHVHRHVPADILHENKDESNFNCRTSAEMDLLYRVRPRY